MHSTLPDDASWCKGRQNRLRNTTNEIRRTRTCALFGVHLVQKKLSKLVNCSDGVLQFESPPTCLQNTFHCHSYKNRRPGRNRLCDPVTYPKRLSQSQSVVLIPTCRPTSFRWCTDNTVVHKFHGLVSIWPYDNYCTHAYSHFGSGTSLGAEMLHGVYAHVKILHKTQNYEAVRRVLRLGLLLPPHPSKRGTTQPAAPSHLVREWNLPGIYMAIITRFSSLTRTGK